MRLPPAILANAEEVLREILRFTAPADTTLSRYFRDHPRLGSRERGAFAEAGNGPTMRRLTILGLAEAMGADSLGGLTEEEVEWLERIKQIDRNLMPATMRANMPKWLFDKLIVQFGETETMLLADALNAPASLDLRINSLKSTREDVMLA